MLQSEGRPRASGDCQVDEDPTAGTSLGLKANILNHSQQGQEVPDRGVLCFALRDMTPGSFTNRLARSLQLSSSCNKRRFSYQTGIYRLRPSIASVRPSLVYAFTASKKDLTKFDGASDAIKSSHYPLNSYL